MEKETYLTFLLGKELFAVNVVNVLEVLEQQHITRVPNAPQHVLGIINFRGEILPVVSTQSKFNMLMEIHDEVKNYVIVYVIERNGQQVPIAATADGVKDVIEISPEEIKPVPEMGMNYDGRFIVGAIRRDENFILLIDTSRVFSLSDTEITKQTEVATN